MAAAEPVVTELTIDGSGAERGQGQYVRAMDAAKAAMEKAIATNARLIETQDKQVRANELVSAANDNLARSYGAASDSASSASSSFRNSGIEFATSAAHIKTAAAALYVFSPAFRGLVTDIATSSPVLTGLRLIGPAAVAAGGAIISALSPALAFISRIAIPITIVIEAFRAMGAITALGEAKFKELNDLASNASKAGVSTESFQRQTQAAAQFSIEAKVATDAMIKFNEASQPKGGEGIIEKRIAELTVLGNFVGNIGVEAYNRAGTTEQRYAAVVTLITTAMQNGQRLAALDLAEKFLPPEMVNRLRASGEFLSDMRRAASEVKAVELIPQAEISYAQDLKNRIAESERILSEKWAPVQRDLTTLGLNYKESWVIINEMLATAVGYGTSLYNYFKGISDLFANMGNAQWIRTLVDITGRLGLNSVPQGMIVNTPQNPAAVQQSFAQDQVRAALASRVRDTAAMTADMKLATDIQTKLFGDKSIMKKAEEVKAVAGEFDRLLASMERATAGVEADAKAVGTSVGEHARLRAEFRLIEAAQQDIKKNGGSLDDYSARIKTMADRAGEAAAALEKAKIASQIGRDRQTAFLSPEDVQIANQLKGLYPDITTALNSSEAAAMRLNSALKSIGDAGGQALSTFVKTFAETRDIAKATEAAAKGLLTTIIDVSAKRLVNAGLDAAFGSTAGMATGATTAAGILATAGTTLAAAMIAGATEAAAILAGGGVTAGTEVATGGAVAGTTMAVGGTTAATELEVAAPIIGLAINGPIVAAIAAIAAAAALLFSFGSGGDDGLSKQIKVWQDAMRRSFDFDQRRLQAQDDGSLASKLQLFDRDAAKQRLDELLKEFPQMAQLEAALAAERIQIIDKFAKEAADRERQHQEAIARAQDSAQERIFAATSDTTTLEGARAEQEHRFARERLDQQKEIGFVTTDLLAAQQAEEFALRKSFNDKILDQTKQAEEARLTALNGAAKSVVDYLAGLQSGPNATVSPLANLSNSQSLYNANLALAQGGNIDAQNKFSSLADNLEKAARAVYASSQGYQDIRSQILAQGLALPAVQQTTDPVVQAMRDVLAAINVGNASQALDATLQGVIKSAIDSGNAAAFAAAISPRFDQLNTTADQGLTFSELVAGVTGLSRDTTTAGLLTQAQIDSLGFARNATVGQLLTSAQLAALGLSRDATVSALDTGNLSLIFRELDGNGDGLLEKTDFILRKANDTAIYTNSVAGSTDLTRKSAGSIDNRVDLSLGILNAIKDLQATSSGTLTTLRDAFVAGGATHFDLRTSTPSLTQNDNSDAVITTLRKIVYNTGIIAYNTANIPGSHAYGVFAQGGIAQPGQSIIYGEHHPQGPFFGRVGSDPIAITPAMPSFRGGANDNSALLAEMRELRKEVTRLQTIVAGSAANVARAVVETGEKGVDATKEHTQKTTAEMRMVKRRAANA